MNSILRYFSLCLFFVGVYCNSFAQSHTVDSLQNVLNRATDDTTRLRLYSALCDSCDVKDNLKYAEPLVQLADKMLSKIHDENERKNILKQKANAFSYFIAYYQKYEGDATPKALGYHQQMLSIYKEIDDKKDIADAIYNIGFDYARQGNVLKQLDYYQEGITLLGKMGYKKGIQILLSQIANIYITYGDTTHALEKMQMSLSMAQELNDTNSIGSNLINMGELYSRINNPVKALEYYQKAILLFEKKKKKKKNAVGMVYLNIGIMYYIGGNLTKALEYYEKYLPIATEGTNKYMLSRVLLAISQVYNRQGNYTAALKYCNKALEAAKGFNLETGRCYEWMTAIYVSEKNYPVAKKYCEQCLTVMKKNSETQSISAAEMELARIDSALGDYKSAYEHYRQYVIFRDKLNSENLHKAIVKEEFQSEYEKKKVIDKAEQDKKEAIHQEEKKKQKVIVYAENGGLALVLVFAFFIFRGYRQKQKANLLLLDKNKIIEEKNHDITSSITYAKRIQQARLPNREEITSSFPQNFILFKPKDIVSGDFYFFHKHNQSVFIAAADCTGHGVPGAFMSIICSEKLNMAVTESTDTSAILRYLNKELKKTLHQDNNYESTRDGMDIALCSVDMVNCIVKYAGANRPFYFIRNKHTEVEEIKGTKKAIGGFTEDDQHFDTHEIKLEKGDSFYIFSDGYADTFGGHHDKKMTTKRFKQILLEIQDKSMKEQEKQLDSFIENWKAETEQIDDILVIGVRL